MKFHNPVLIFSAYALLGYTNKGVATWIFNFTTDSRHFNGSRAAVPGLPLAAAARAITQCAKQCVADGDGCTSLTINAATGSCSLASKSEAPPDSGVLVVVKQAGPLTKAATVTPAAAHLTNFALARTPTTLSVSTQSSEYYRSSSKEATYSTTSVQGASNDGSSVIDGSTAGLSSSKPEIYIPGSVSEWMSSERATALQVLTNASQSDIGTDMAAALTTNAPTTAFVNSTSSTVTQPADAVQQSEANLTVSGDALSTMNSHLLLTYTTYTTLSAPKTNGTASEMMISGGVTRDTNGTLFTIAGDSTTPSALGNTYNDGSLLSTVSGSKGVLYNLSLLTIATTSCCTSFNSSAAGAVFSTWSSSGCPLKIEMDNNGVSKLGLEKVELESKHFVYIAANLSGILAVSTDNSVYYKAYTSRTNSCNKGGDVIKIEGVQNVTDIFFYNKSAYARFTNGSICKIFTTSPTPCSAPQNGMGISFKFLALSSEDYKNNFYVIIRENNTLWYVSNASLSIPCGKQEWKSLSYGPSGLWAVDINGTAMYNDGTAGSNATCSVTWKTFPGVFSSVSSGANAVMLLATNSTCYLLQNVNDTNPFGIGIAVCKFHLRQAVMTIQNTIWGIDQNSSDIVTSLVSSW